MNINIIFPIICLFFYKLRIKKDILFSFIPDTSNWENIALNTFFPNIKNLLPLKLAQQIVWIGDRRYILIHGSFLAFALQFQSLSLKYSKVVHFPMISTLIQTINTIILVKISQTNNMYKQKDYNRLNLKVFGLSF